ncbi:MAG: hypothetical protein KI792_10285 [Alphaproteobacteria bacterium]|nr:hypothetical protein [Alphaproteobacteria bacterium SS10]
MSKKINSQKPLGQRGISLTEAILGVATLGIGLGAIANLQVDNLRRVKAEQTAQQLAAVRDAAAAYVIDNYGDIIDGGNADIGDPVAGGAAQQLDDDALDGYLDPRFFDGADIRKNAFGHDLNIYVLNIGGERLRVQVVSEDDGTGSYEHIEPTTAAQIAAAVGADAGWRAADPTELGFGSDVSGVYADNTTYGAFGGWELDNADLGVPPERGGLAAMAFFGEGGVVADFLYRNSIPGQPEAQQMNANINMGEFGLANVAQIGAPLNGAALAQDGNPEVGQNGLQTNTVPLPAPAVFAPAAAPRVDLNADGELDSNFDPAVGAGTNENVIRFGNDNQTGANAAYARGNVNIVGGDAIFGFVDAEERVRAQQRVEAANRALPNGQRAILDSGLDVDGVEVALVAPAAGVRSTDPGFKLYDAANIERGNFTFDDTGSQAGQISAGTDTGALATRRIELNYGLDELNAREPTAGNITLRDGVAAAPRAQTSYTSEGGNARGVTFFNDGLQERMRLDYGFDRAGNVLPDAGNFTMTDASGVRDRVQFDYGQNRAGNGVIPEAGTFVMRDNANNERLRSEFGLDAAGTAASNARGLVRVGDETGVERFVQQYDSPTAGRFGVRDQVNQAADAERFVSRYDGNVGQNIMRDDGATQRVMNQYDAATGSVELADVGGNQRVLADYTGGTGQIAIGNDTTGVDPRFVSNYTALTGRLSMNDGGSRRLLADYDATTGQIAIGNDTAANSRFAANYGAGSGRLELNDGANDRFRTDYFGADGNLVFSDGTNNRLAAIYNATDTNVVMSDSAGRNRNQFVSSGNSAFVRVRDTAGTVRYEFETDAAAGVERLNDAAGNLRRQFDTASGVQDWRAADGVERAIVNSNNGQFRLSAADANTPTAGGYFLVDPNDGGVEIGSGNNQTSFIDFKGTGSLGADYDGRIAYSDGNNTFGIRNNGQATDTMQIVSNATRNVVRILDQAGTNRVVLRGESDAAQPSLIVNNAAGGNRMRFFTESAAADGALKLGAGALVGASPLGADQSYLDVDDIYLRGRDVWLSDTNVSEQLIVSGVEVLSDGQTVSATLRNRCLTPTGGGAGTIFYAATPAWWVTPVMIAQTRITQLQDGDGAGTAQDDVIRVTDIDDINPADGTELAGGDYDNNTQGRVYMTGGGTLVMEARQKNDLAPWRQMTNGVAVVTVYCQL